MKPRKAKARILIVEDETIVAFDLSSRLEALGFAVIGVASNGHAAIEMAGREKPDMVLMDIMLGGDMDGIEAAKKINEKDFIPIIYLTAYSDQRTLERAKLSEPFGYILKPFEEQELRSTIEMALYKYSIEKKLKESEERYRIVAEQTGQIIYDYDMTTGQISWAGAIHNVTGYTPEEYQTFGIKEWEEFIHPEDRERVFSELEKAINKLESFLGTYRYKHKDNHYFYVEDNGIFIKRNGDQNLRMLGTISNITERILAEEEHVLNEKRIESLLHLHNMNVEPISDFTNYALKQGIKLTKSKIGYIAFVSDNEKSMSMYTWSEEIVTNSNVKELPFIIELEKNGLLGETVRIKKPVVFNNYKKNVDPTKGYPEWHVDLERYLSIPVVDDSRVVIVAGVGNKETDYNDSDVKQLTLLMTEMYHIIKAKKSEAALKESEQKYKDLTEMLPITVFETNVVGIITYANNTALKLFGYSQEEYRKGVNVLALLHPDNREKASENMRKILSAENTSDSEYIALKRDGSLFHIIVNTIPIRKDGKIIGLRGAITDISDRKSAEKSLAASESRLRQIIDAIPQLVFAKDREGKYILVNKSFAELVNIPAKDILGKTAFEVFKHTSLADTFAAEDKETFRKEEAQILFTEIPDSNGIVRFFQVTKMPFFFANEELPSLLGVATDITESKVYEDALRKLTKAIEQSPVSIVITDIVGAIEYVNPKFTHTFGYTLSEVLGQNPRLLKSGNTPNAVYKELWDTILSGQEWRGELLNKKKDGDFIWESISISPIKNEERTITPFVAVREDITDKKEMEEELRRAVNKAEESSRLKSSLIGNMSHEFRTPLVGILGFTQFLSETVSDPEQLSMLERITKSAKRLTNTLNGILQYAQLEGNEIQADIQQLMIDKYIRYMYKQFIPAAEDKLLKLEVKILKENVNVLVDERLFSLVMTNLIDNAIKFTNKGSITITVELEEQFDESWGIVKVKDTGIGISDNDKSVIFKEFRQVSEGVSRKYEGTGLGLNISRRIMVLMGGRLSFTSTVNEGSEFTLKIPCVGFEPAEEVLPDDEVQEISELLERSSLLQECILLVEDNEINREVITVYLKNTCKVESARSGEAAIEMAKNKDYSAVLMDINLGGGMNGMEASEKIKQLPGYSKTPIVAVTGYTMAHERDSFLEKGFVAHLSKPFDQNELIELVNKILRQKY